MWMRACYIAKRSAGEMICQSSVYLVAGKNSIFISLFLFYHPTEIIRKNKCPLETWIKVRMHYSYVYQQGLHTGFIDTPETPEVCKSVSSCLISFFLKHIFHSYHFVFTQVIYVLILKCAWWPSIFKCSKTKTSGRE